MKWKSALALWCVPAIATSQHQHDMAMPRADAFHISGSVVPLVTRATPTADRRSITEAYLAQPMLNAAWANARFFAVATLDAEGLTMRHGELNTGMEGEGFVDRRHPHTYLHELVAGFTLRDPAVEGPNLSLTAGKGFVPFGSDDPMMRPTVKYPINHHLAQILERAFVSIGARYGFLTLEAATFNGDEPTSPASSPTLRNFGDSWAARLIADYRGFEASASYAFVTSPENADGQALDQRKRHLGIHWSGQVLGGPLSVLGEWARSTEQSHTSVSPILSSWLAEGEWREPASELRVAVRLERSDRAEELRASDDPFRTPLPITDHSLLGITRWSVITATLSRDLMLRRFRVAPFVEGSALRPRSLDGGFLFDPATFYGSRTLWLVSAGARLTVGPGHQGMGYYGVRRVSMNHAHN